MIEEPDPVWASKVGGGGDWSLKQHNLRRRFGIKGDVIYP